jgi:hypothetical protein
MSFECVLYQNCSGDDYQGTTTTVAFTTARLILQHREHLCSAGHRMGRIVSISTRVLNQHSNAFRFGGLPISAMEQRHPSCQIVRIKLAQG